MNYYYYHQMDIYVGGKEEEQGEGDELRKMHQQIKIE